jgi:hypothetical protein
MLHPGVHRRGYLLVNHFPLEGVDPRVVEDTLLLTFVKVEVSQVVDARDNLGSSEVGGSEIRRSDIFVLLRILL